MPYIRFRLDLAVEETAYQAIPAATKLAIRDQIRKLKTFASKINAGKPNEEATIRAVWHRCTNDINQSCEPDTDV